MLIVSSPRYGLLPFCHGFGFKIIMFVYESLMFCLLVIINVSPSEATESKPDR